MSDFAHVHHCLLMKKSLRVTLHLRSKPSWSRPADVQRVDTIFTETSLMQLDGPVAELRRLIVEEPLTPLDKNMKDLLWAHRSKFMNIPCALSRMLSSVNWSDPVQSEEALALSSRWATLSITAYYIELLSGKFSEKRVREFAVGKVAEMPDATLSLFLPQLVQALKNEATITSPLALMPLERAVRSPNQIGMDLFWLMTAETYSEKYRDLYGMIINTLVNPSTSATRLMLRLQVELFGSGGMFDRLCSDIRGQDTERSIQDGLVRINEMLPSAWILPISPRYEVGKLIVEKCVVINLERKQLMLAFENADAGCEPVSVTFRSGDENVCPEIVVVRLMRFMNEMWRSEGLELAMEPYACVATSPSTGVAEVIDDSKPLADLCHLNYDGICVGRGTEANPLADWIAASNPIRRDEKRAVGLFLRSWAGCFVAEWALAITDRHGGNVKVSRSGRLFHVSIDQFLGQDISNGGLFEPPAPFLYRTEMKKLLGSQSRDLSKFVDTACHAFTILREHSHLLTTLLVLMVRAGMRDLTSQESVEQFISRLHLGMSKPQWREALTGAIYECLGEKYHPGEGCRYISHV